MDDRSLTLVYVYLSLYAAAAVLFLLFARWRTALVAFLVLGTGLLLQASVTAGRAFEGGRPPWQSKYEVFQMTMGCLVLWLTLVHAIYRPWRLRTSGRAFVGVVSALVIAAALLFGAMSLRQDYDIADLPPALQSGWFATHVSAYMLGYSSLYIAAIVSATYIVLYLKNRSNTIPFETTEGALNLERLTHTVNSIGFPFLTLGVFQGAVWAEDAWGTYWGWDIKETWALISWLTFLVYFHLRMVAGWRGARSALVVLVGAIVVAITYVGVNHMPAAVSSMHTYN